MILHELRTAMTGYDNHCFFDHLDNPSSVMLRIDSSLVGGHEVESVSHLILTESRIVSQQTVGTYITLALSLL